MVDRTATIELVVRTRGGAEVRRVRRDATDLRRIQEDINDATQKGFLVETRRTRTTRELGAATQRLVERYDRGAREARKFANEQRLLNRQVEQGIITQRQANEVLRQREAFLSQAAARQRARTASDALQGATTLGGTVGRGAAVGRGVLGIGVGLAPAVGIAGAFGAAFAARNIVQTSGEYQILEARIRDATRATGDFAAVQEDLLRIAQSTYTPLEASVTLFQRLATARDDLEVTNDEILTIVDNVQKLGIISGANQQQLRAGLIQLAQSFASNIVRAEEMNSILENIPGVARVIAEQMGMTTGQLRIAVTEGEVLSSQFADVLKSTEVTADAMRRFREQPRTIARQSEQISIQWKSTADAINEALGFTQLWRATLDLALSTLRGIESVSRSIAEATPSGAAELERADRLRPIAGLPRLNEGARSGPGRAVTPPPTTISISRPEPEEPFVGPLYRGQAAQSRNVRETQERLAREAERAARQQATAAREQERLAREAEAQQKEKMRLLQEEVELRQEIWRTERESMDFRLGRTQEQIEQQNRVLDQQRAMQESIVQLGFGLSDAAVEAALFGSSVSEAVAEAARAVMTQLVQALARAVILMGITGITGTGPAGGFLSIFGGQLGLPIPGGFAGRSTRPGRMYRVNEGRPETFVQGGNTYLMAGGAPGRIEPAPAASMTRPLVQIMNMSGARVSARETGSGTQIMIEEAVRASEANLTRQIATGSGGFAKAMKSAHGRRQLR